MIYHQSVWKFMSIRGEPLQGACPTVLRDMCDLLTLVEAAAM